jgi:hypothetical protein
MSKDYLPETNENPTIPNPTTPTEPGDRDPLRMLLIGSRQRVIAEIHNLYVRGFAKVEDWSPLLPAPTPGKVMSILTKYSDKVIN